MDPAEFWATGDYAVVGDLWAQPGRDLVASLPVQGQDVVDLATGTGVTAITAAAHGAQSVVGVDVTPGLLREAARRAGRARVDVTWVTADFLAVPLPSGCADLVTSTFGVVFAADPHAAWPGPAAGSSSRAGPRPASSAGSGRRWPRSFPRLPSRGTRRWQVCTRWRARTLRSPRSRSS